MMFYHKLQKWALRFEKILNFKFRRREGVGNHEDELKTMGRDLGRLRHGSLAVGAVERAGDRHSNAGDGDSE